MARPSHREKILTEGLRVVHAQGFNGASVRDIVQAAGVPQGSFTNHFPSKEAFGIEVLDRYAAKAIELADATLRNTSRAPLERLRAWIDVAKEAPDIKRNGCLLGNFSAEIGTHCEALRTRVVGIFAELQEAIAACLRDGVASGDLAPDLDCEAMAGFILSSLQGATLMAKAEQSPAALERFEQMLFATVLRRR
jgi:TetR/AcrR family transcriptional repressor of nem operon